MDSADRSQLATSEVVHDGEAPQDRSDVSIFDVGDCSLLGRLEVIRMPMDPGLGLIHSPWATACSRELGVDLAQKGWIFRVHREFFAH